jgi:hypothetical protein
LSASLAAPTSSPGRRSNAKAGAAGEPANAPREPRPADGSRRWYRRAVVEGPGVAHDPGVGRTANLGRPVLVAERKRRASSRQDDRSRGNCRRFAGNLARLGAARKGPSARSDRPSSLLSARNWMIQNESETQLTSIEVAKTAFQLAFNQGVVGSSPTALTT